MSLGELLGVIGAITTGVILGLLTPINKRAEKSPVPVPVHDDNRPQPKK